MRIYVLTFGSAGNARGFFSLDKAVEAIEASAAVCENGHGSREAAFFSAPSISSAARVGPEELAGALSEAGRVYARPVIPTSGHVSEVGPVVAELRRVVVEDGGR